MRIFTAILFISLYGCAGVGGLSYKTDEHGTWSWSDAGEYYIVQWKIESAPTADDGILWNRRAESLCSGEVLKKSYNGAKSLTSDYMTGAGGVYGTYKKESTYVGGTIWCGDNIQHVAAHDLDQWLRRDKE